MIRFQIIERTGANLHKTLVEAMRAGELRTFEATRRGRRIQHKNVSYPGWMNWSVLDGVINCEVVSPHKPGREWQFFSAFLGRLADRYADRIVAINVQFPGLARAPGRPARPPRHAGLAASDCALARGGAQENLPYRPKIPWVVRSKQKKTADPLISFPDNCICP